MARADGLLAIDVGTQSTRALLFDLQGRLRLKRQRALTDYRHPQPGWVTHEAEAFWQHSAACVRALWEEADPACVAGLAVTTQRATLLPVDADGQALDDAMVWMDLRRATQLPPLHWAWRAAFGLAGVSGTIARLQADAEINWWAQHRPAQHARTARYLLLSGWLHRHLVGEFVDSAGNQVGYLPFDARRQDWARRWDWKWQALACHPAQLPRLKPVAQRLGGLTPGAAALLGLPAGLPVLAAATDKACEALGAGALAPSIGALSLGTTATLNQTLSRFVEPEAFVPPFPAAVPGHYSLEAQVPRGFWLVSWFRDQFAPEERAAAARLGLPPERLLDDLAAPLPPGSDGLIALPTWQAGVRTPGPEARGAFIGWHAGHTRAHLYRAILEGLAYALREGAERLQRRSGVPLQVLHAAGGGAQSDLALQIMADVFNRPVGRPHTVETAGLGAAMNAAVGLGLHADSASAVRAMTRIERWFQPQPEAAARYEQLYQGVYRPLYGRLRPLFERLSAASSAA